MKLINSFKNIAALFPFVFSFIISCSTEKEELPIKILAEFRTTKYLYVDGKLDSLGTLYERIIFNKSGKDSIIENYDDTGSLYLRTVLYYDSAGNKIKTIDYKSDGKLESETEFKYSPDGQLLERKREHVNGGYNRGQFFYNEKGEVTREIDLYYGEIKN